MLQIAYEKVVIRERREYVLIACLAELIIEICNFNIIGNNGMVLVIVNRTRIR